MKTVKDWVKDLVRPEVMALSAYHVPETGRLLKLDAMENPWALPDALRAQWLQVLESVQINRYPNPAAPTVKAGLRKMMGLSSQYELLLGNGSDELIQLVAMALAKPGASVLSVEPSFVMYKMIAQFLGLQYHGVALTEDFALDRETLLAAIKTHQPALVFLAQPNNPTGNLFDATIVEEIIAVTPGLVVVDEAYLAFTDSDALPLLDRHPNVLIMRTLSKVGLAGLRLGILAGAPEWIREIDKLRLPYNINVLTQASAAFLLDHYDTFREQTARLRAARTDLIQALRVLPLERVWPSEANFVLVRAPAGEARAVFEALKKSGVLIKCLDGAHPLLKDCLRITVGTPQENQQMLAALEKSLID
ncbi:Histidinol-phosphate aminotransferase [gamma proteobacterium HdN1]|nr:Histidinol-phosphate aminotransferase [gamma proteobacterium HdN1]